MPSDERSVEAILCMHGPLRFVVAAVGADRMLR